MAINTNGLSGYAASWANAFNSNGGNSIAANATANTATYGNAAGPTTAAQVAQALSGTGLTPAPTTKTTNNNNISQSLITGNSDSKSLGGGLLPSVNDLINGQYNQLYAPQLSEYNGDRNAWEQADNAYRASLLNKNNLPGNYLSDGSKYAYAQQPTGTGWSSKDLLGTDFRTTALGNIERVDHTNGGDVITFIPNLGGWKQTASGKNDPAVGDAYSRQRSAHGFETRYVRGSEIGSTPYWYDDNAQNNWLNNALYAVNNGGNTASLLPASEYYQSFYNGNNNINNSLIPLADYSDIDAQILAAGENPGNYTPEEKEQLRQMIMYGG